MYAAGRVEEMGEVGGAKYGGQGTCRAPGCERGYKPRGQDGCGRGYCGKHYSAWRRSGHPLGMEYVARERLAQAALDFTESRSQARLEALKSAAQEAMRSRRGGVKPVFDKPADHKALAVLTQAALAYGDCDTDEEFDDLFAILREQLMAAAVAFGRAMASYPTHRHYKARMAIAVKVSVDAAA